jgi:transposase InsO family protein
MKPDALLHHSDQGSPYRITDLSGFRAYPEQRLAAVSRSWLDEAIARARRHSTTSEPAA